MSIYYVSLVYIVLPGSQQSAASRNVSLDWRFVLNQYGKPTMLLFLRKYFDIVMQIKKKLSKGKVSKAVEQIA